MPQSLIIHLGFKIHEQYLDSHFWESFMHASACDRRRRIIEALRLMNSLCRVEAITGIRVAMELVTRSAAISSAHFPPAVGRNPMATAVSEKRIRAPVLGWDLPDVWTPQRTLQPLFSLPQGNLAVEPTAAVIDGKAIAKDIRTEVAAEVSRMKDALGKVPGLAVVLVGARKDSETYVRNKKKACEEVGISSLGIDLPEYSSEDEVLRAVTSFNDDPSVHGVLVQLPLPQHISEEKILNAVSMQKDVDGFHPLNIGRLAMQGREPLFIPCTPKGCIELLLRCGIDIMGKRAVVIGRSNVVGMPASMLWQRHNATVTMVHSYTKNPAGITREADIVISAAGVANLVRGDWLKPGAVVIDVGINAVEDPNSKRGYRLVGDVCYEEASRVASAITPVPGGVGPMTIAMLLSNTLDSAKRAYGFS